MAIFGWFCAATFLALITAAAVFGMLFHYALTEKKPGAADYLALLGIACCWYVLATHAPFVLSAG